MKLKISGKNTPANEITDFEQTYIIVTNNEAI